MEVRDYTEGNEIQIIELFEIVFHKKMSLDYWNWRFRNNPVGKFMIKLMWDNEKLVGHYAVCPVEVIQDENERLSALSMTTMTHPDYTGLGIFQQLADSLYNDMQSLYEAVSVWGFPNNNSHRGFIKNLGWKDVTAIPMMSCDTSLLKAVKSEEIYTIDEFFDQHARLSDLHFSEYKFRVKRNSEYLNWRYINNPDNTYTVLNSADGFVVCKEYQLPNQSRKQLDIIDWCLPVNERQTKIFLQHIAAVFPHEEYAQFNIWMPLHDERHLYFEKLGFSNTVPVTYLGVRMFKNALPATAAGWWVQLGDSDVY